MNLFGIALMAAKNYRDHTWVITDSDNSTIYEGDLKGVFELPDEILAREEHSDGLSEDGKVVIKLA